MAKLALWGAVAGGAKGYQEHLGGEAKKAAADVDAAREERMLKLRQGHTEKMATRREEHEIGMESQRQEGRMEISGEQGFNAENVETLRQSYMTARGDTKIESTESEGQLDRESRERIAKIQASATSAGARRALSRYEAKILSKSEANEYGIPIEVDTPAVFDKLSAKWYLQEGDQLRMPGETEQSRRAPAGAINALYSEPERASVFYTKYRYLPMDYLGVINEAAALTFQSPAQ